MDDRWFGIGGRGCYPAINTNTRTVSYFFTSRDENKLSSAILNQFSNAMFIDMWAWADSHDLSQSSRDSIADCKTDCYIWDPDSVPQFPINTKPTFYVAHFSKCRVVNGNELCLGQTGFKIDPNDEKQKGFRNSILRLIRKLKSGPLDVYNYADDTLLNTGITNFIVGPDAYARSHTELLLTYGPCHYKPSAGIAT